MLSKDLSGCYFEKTEEARSTRRPLSLSRQDVSVAGTKVVPVKEWAARASNRTVCSEEHVLWQL